MEEMYLEELFLVLSVFINWSYSSLILPLIGIPIGLISGYW